MTLEVAMSSVLFVVVRGHMINLEWLSLFKYILRKSAISYCLMYLFTDYLIVLYVLATSKVILEQVLTCNSAYS